MNPDNPNFRTSEEKRRTEDYQKQIKELEESLALAVSTLNKIGILGHSEHAYTKEFTERTMALVKSTLAKLYLP